MKKIAFVCSLFFLFIASFYSKGETANQTTPVTPEEREYNLCVFINIFHEYGATNECLNSTDGAVTETGKLDFVKSGPCFQKTALKIRASVKDCTTYRGEETAEIKPPEVTFGNDDYYLCIARGVAHEYRHTKPCLVMAGAMTSKEKLGIIITSSGHMNFIITAKEHQDSGVTITTKRPLDPIKSELCLRSTALTMTSFIEDICSDYLKLE